MNLREIARSYRKNIRSRETLLPLGPPMNPAWLILLELYIHRGSHWDLSVTAIALAADIPPTTSLRWLGELEDRGLIDRKADQQDRRRSHVRLTQDGLVMVETMLVQLATSLGLSRNEAAGSPEPVRVDPQCLSA